MKTILFILLYENDKLNLAQKKRKKEKKRKRENAKLNHTHNIRISC